MSENKIYIHIASFDIRNSNPTMLKILEEKFNTQLCRLSDASYALSPYPKETMFFKKENTIKMYIEEFLLKLMAENQKEIDIDQAEILKMLRSVDLPTKNMAIDLVINNFQYLCNRNLLEEVVFGKQWKLDALKSHVREIESALYHKVQMAAHIYNYLKGEKTWT